MNNEIPQALTAAAAVHYSMLDWIPGLNSPEGYITLLEGYGYTVTKMNTEQESTAHDIKIHSWDDFLRYATDVFVQKNTDYNSRFTRALIDFDKKQGRGAAKAIWAWEVEKKLDRCRTWIQRGQLLVKDEGVLNSVVDIFNYTVQYSLFIIPFPSYADKLANLTRNTFYDYAARYTSPQNYVNYLEDQGLLDPRNETDAKVAQLLVDVMNGAHE